MLSSDSCERSWCFSATQVCATGKSRVCLDNNPCIFHSLCQVPLLVPRMHFYLVDDRRVFLPKKTHRH